MINILLSEFTGPSSLSPRVQLLVVEKVACGIEIYLGIRRNVTIKFVLQLLFCLLLKFFLLIQFYV